MNCAQYLINGAMQKEAKIYFRIPNVFSPKDTDDLITLGKEDPKHPPMTPEEERAAIEESRQALSKRLNVTPFLTGSMALGTNVPGSVDLDYMVQLKSKEKMLRLANKLRKNPEFKTSPYHSGMSDYQIFMWDRKNKLPVDIALVYGDKADKYKSTVREVINKLTPEEREQIRKEKARLQQAWFMRQSRYRKYKRELDERLGIKQVRISDEPLDKEAEELEDLKDLAPAIENTEVLKKRIQRMLSKPSVFAHRTSDLTSLVESGRQLTAEEAARKGLLKTIEETKGIRGRAAYDPEKHKNLRKELFGTEGGIMPVGEDYGKYGLVRYSKSKRPSPYINLVPNEVISPRNTGMKTAIFLVPKEELVEWQTKYPDKRFLSNEDIPEDLVLPNRRFIHLPVRALRQITNLLTLRPTPLVG